MKFQGICVVSAMVLLGCSVEPEDNIFEPDDSEDIEFDEATVEIVENLQVAGYPEGEIEVRDDGTVWVGGDAVVSLGASREMIGLTSRTDPDEVADLDQFRQYRTNNLVGDSVETICVDGSGLSNGTLSQALDNAIDNYNNVGLSFTFVRNDGPAAPGCDAMITANQVGGTGGSAGFPTGGLPYATINIGAGIASYGLPETTHVTVHELGHCIGLRHSDYYNRSISCNSGGNEGPAGVGAVHIPGTPTDAVWNGSVMNSCYNLSSTGAFTPSDITALLEMYPPPPPPNPNSCEETNSCGAMAPGGCWCDDICTYYGDCCFDGPCGGAPPPPPPPPDPNSCVDTGSCGTQAPGSCWCDGWCTYYGDCCADGPC